MTRVNALATFLAVALAYPVAKAHMIMLTPTPFNNETIDNSPLEASGSNYPCKSTGQAGFYNAAGISNVMAIGEKKTLSFRGSAVHGGGSCQLAITTDKAPTPSTTWQVIQSIEGGCPSTNGQGPSTYEYSIPQGVPPGDYVFAWTWVSKLAGQPEYYMNCAPITVTGGSSKRDEISAPAKRSSLPNLAVFNLQSVNSCKSTLGSDPVFPDPGPNVVKPGASPSYAPLVGTNCFPVGGSASGGGSSSNPTSPSASKAGAPAISAPAGALNGSPGSSLASSASSAAALSASSPAAFTSSPSSSPAFAKASSTTGSPAAPTGLAQPSSGTGSPAATTGLAQPGSSPSASQPAGLTGACSTEGIWNCLNGNSYQRCASGQWTAVTAMPGGTTCTPGQSENLFARHIRHSRRHIRMQARGL